VIFTPPPGSITDAEVNAIKEELLATFADRSAKATEAYTAVQSAVDEVSAAVDACGERAIP